MLAGGSRNSRINRCRSSSPTRVPSTSSTSRNGNHCVAPGNTTNRKSDRSRRLRSDFLFVVFPGATQWFPFRDVLDVDGTRVGDDERQRLMRLFLEPPASMQRREEELRAAGARYNLT